MPFVTVGVEHRTAPLTVREAAAMDREQIAAVSTELRRHAAIDEVTILSTCNRTEIYLFGNDSSAAVEPAERLLAARDQRISPFLQRWEEMAGAEHIFRVACGLESQALGEAQILAQVRNAMETAAELDTIGPHLHALFRAAISCARQARAGTALGRVNVSLAGEAVQAAEAALGTLHGRRVLLIGGGEISRRVAEELRGHRLGTLYIANRTASAAEDLARLSSGRAVRLADLPRLTPAVDLIISATAAPRHVLTVDHFPVDGLPDRSDPLYIFDLAIPRDVDPTVDTLPGVVLHDLDDLLPAGTTDQWAEDIRAMDAVIAAELHEFHAWYLTRRVVPVIANLRSHVEAVSEQELKRVAPQLRDLSDRERAAVESLTQRLIDKMFHHLVTRLRLAAQTDPALVDAAEFFFLHGEGGLFEHAAQSARETAADERATDIPAVEAPLIEDL